MYIASKVILKYAVQGTQYVLAEFQVDTASNLPSSTSDTKISIGSKADVIDTGAVYKMGANDTWVLQEAGTAGYSKAEVDQLIQDTKDYADGEILGAINDLDVSAVGGTTKYVYQISQADGLIYASAYTSDSSPTTGSTKLVQSGGVKTYVDTAEANAKADWFLLGTQITAATAHANNLNNYKTPGHYYIASNTTAGNVDNTPVNYAGKLNVELISNSTNYIRQTYYANTDSTALISVRRYKGVDPDTQEDIWSEWMTIPTQNDIIPSTFGVLNATILSSSGFDCDTALTPGVYIAGNTTYAQNAKGRPDYANAGANIWRMEVKLLNSVRVFQEMYVYRVGTYEGDFDKYQRMRRTDGTWNDWQHIETTSAGTYYPPNPNLQGLGGDMRSTLNEEQEEIQDEIIQDEEIDEEER